MGCVVSVQSNPRSKPRHSKHRSKHRHDNHKNAYHSTQTDLKDVLARKPVVCRETICSTRQTTRQDGRVVHSHRVKDHRHEILTDQKHKKHKEEKYKTENPKSPTEQESEEKPALKPQEEDQDTKDA